MKKKISLEKKILYGFIINILIAIAFSWVSYKRTQNHTSLSLLEENHNTIILSISKTLSNLNTYDNNSNIYVITADEKYLDQLNLSLYQVQSELHYLNAQFASDNVQKKRITELETLLNKKFLNTSRYVELRKYKDFAAARDFILNKEKIQLHNNIIDRITTIRDIENSAFTKIKDQKVALEKILKPIYYVLLFFLITLLFVVYFIIRRQVKQKKESEQLLEANNQLMRSVLDNTNNLIFIKKLNGQYLLVNKKIEDLFNLAPDQVIGKTDHDAFPKEIADSLMSGDIDVIKAKEEIKFEETITFKGETRNYIFVKFPVWDFENNLYAIGGIATDISERSQSDLLLKEREAEAQITFNSAPDAIAVINHEGNIIKWNNQSEVLFGWKAEEVLGKQMQETILPLKYQDKHSQLIKYILKTGKSPILNKTIEVTAINKNNIEFDIEINISSAKVKDKYIFIAFMRDVTQRKQLQKKLEDSEKFQNSIIQNIPSIIFIKDASDLHFTLINKAAEVHFGYKKNELIGKDLYSILPPEQADLITKQEKEVLSKGEPLYIPEEKSTLKAGDYWLHTKKIPIKDESGKPLYLLVISENVTEQKMLEEKKKETEKLLHQNVQRVELILENIGEGVIVVDKYGEIILTNNMAGEIVGIKEDDTIYTTVDWAKDFDLFYPDGNTIFPAQYLPLEKALLKGESTDNLELIIQEPETKVRKHVIVNGRPIVDENNNIIAAVTTIKDITKFTELEESLKTTESKYRNLIGFKMQKKTNINDEKK